MSIKRRIELLLDRAAAKRVQTQTQRALVKGTDPKKPKRNLKKIGGGLNALTGQAAKLGAALLAAFALRKIKDFFVSTLQGFGRQERAILRVNSALTNMGLFTAENSKILQDNAAALQRITTAGDEAILEATATIADLAKELTVGELAMAQEAVIALADTFFDGNLASAASLLAKTLGSSTNALSRYGIEINTAATQSQKLDQILGITNDLFLTSQRAATDLTGRTAQLSNSWGDLLEAIGKILARGSGLTGLLVTIREKIDGWTAALEENQAQIGAWIRVFILAVKNGASNLGAMARIAFNVGQLIGRAFDISASLMVGAFFKASELIRVDWGKLANFAQKIFDPLNLVPDIAFEEGAKLSEKFFENARNQAAAFKGDLDDIGAAVGGIADNFWEVFRAAQAAAGAQREAADEARGDAGILNTVEDPAIAAAEEAAARRAQVRRRDAAESRQLEMDQDRESLLIQEAHAAAMVRREERLDSLAAKAAITAEGMTSAFQTFFEASATGFKDAGGVWDAASDAARGAGASIIEAFTAGRAQTETALGVAALASGIWPPNPAAIAAGLKHFAAAALFRAIPGAVRGGGGAGGGGAGGGLPQGAVGLSAPGSTQPPAMEVNIFIDPLSPADPDFQRVVLGAVQSAQERFGANVNVNIHPRTGGR